MEDVCDLEINAVHQDQIAANKNVHVTGRRRRQKGLNVLRAGLHSVPQFGRDESLHDDSTLQSRRETVAFRQPWRQVPVICPVPVPQIAIMVGIMMTPTAVGMMFFMAVSVTLAAASILAIMLVVSVAVALSHCHGRRQKQR